MLARSDYTLNVSVVPPPADPAAVTLTLIAGGAPRAAADAAVAAAVARGAGVPVANVSLSAIGAPPGCAAVCAAWNASVAVGDPHAAAALRVSLDAGANRSILRRVLVATRADAASYNYLGGLADGDREVDAVTELGGAAEGVGGLGPGAVAAIAVGSALVVGVVATVVGVVVVRRRRRGQRLEEGSE